MPNLLEYSEILTTALDQQAIEVATSGWMEANAGRVKYEGGNKVKVPTLLTTGLGDYDRENGKYPKGSMSLTYNDYILTQDRGAEFYFDRNDVDETNYIITATSVMNEFQRASVIPEIDAYRYSTIANTAITAGKAIAETITEANAFSKFVSEVRAMQNETGVDTAGLVAVVPYTIYAMLEAAINLKGNFSPQTFQQGSISFEVKTIDGIPIIPVTSNRMMTKYIFRDGETDFGFEPDPTAKPINWIITPRSLPIAISKTDSLKIFSPDVNQDGDGWKTQYRKYHDIWIMKNQINQMVVSLGE